MCGTGEQQLVALAAAGLAVAVNVDIQRIAQIRRRGPRRAEFVHVIAVVHTARPARSEEHTSELQSLMRISYAVFCLKKKKTPETIRITHKDKQYRASMIK